MRAALLTSPSSTSAELMYTTRIPKIGEAANVPVEIVYIKEEHYSYPPGTNANSSGSAVSAVHYKSTADRLKQMDEHETIRKKNEETVQEDRCEDVQFPTKFQEQRQAFSEMLTEAKSEGNAHLGGINVF